MRRNSYQPINCDLYDYLEMWSVKRIPVDVTYAKGEKQHFISNSFVIDLKTRDHEEFVYFSTGQIIRLDQLIRVNDIDFTLRSC